MDVRAVHWSLCGQISAPKNSGSERITYFTKTTEQCHDDTHFVPSDSSLPDYIRPYLVLQATPYGL